MVFLLVGCGEIPQVYERPSEPVSYSAFTPTSTEEELALLMWNFTNEEREAHGLLPLYWDTDLAEIAQLHGEDMVKRSFYEHVNPDNETPTDRAQSYGYPLRKFLTLETYTEGIRENLGQVRSGNIKDFRRVENTTEDLARAQVDLWMNSEKHRQNVLDPTIDKIGISVVWNGSLYLSTQVFW